MADQDIGVWLNFVGHGVGWTRTEYYLVKREVPGKPLRAPECDGLDGLNSILRKAMEYSGIVNIPDEVMDKIIEFVNDNEVWI